MYVLEPHASGLSGPAEIFGGRWPFERAGFKESLRRGAIDGAHSPTELPDDVRGYGNAVVRRRRQRLLYR